MTKVITNQDVLDAINNCLADRWEPAAQSEDGALPSDAPTCALCVLVEDLDRINGGGLKCVMFAFVVMFRCHV